MLFGWVHIVMHKIYYDFFILFIVSKILFLLNSIIYKAIQVCNTDKL